MSVSQSLTVRWTSTLELILLLLMLSQTTTPTVSQTISNPTIVTFVIDENSPIGTEVGRVRLTDTISHRATRKNTSAVSWQFTLQDTFYFDFDSNQPDRLLVRHALDRDADRRLCSDAGWPDVCAWSGVIFVNDGSLLSLRIVVRDQNDNTPSWPNAPIVHGVTILRVSVPENCALGTRIDLPPASDPDIGENSIVRYEIENLDGNSEITPLPFELTSQVTKSGVVYGLLLRHPIDREETTTYKIPLAAVDGGGNRGMCQLVIDITDENDNRPVFTHLKSHPTWKNLTKVEDFVIHIDEDLPVGSRLPRHPVAEDTDEGDFGRVTYAFAIATLEVVRQDFRLDVTTGALYVRAPLDSDSGGRTQYRFTVVARDQGNPPLMASASVMIQVRDTNDNAPQITITPALSNLPRLDSSHQRGLATLKTRLSLEENAIPEQLIATITVQDLDSDENGKFTCQLGKTNELQLLYRKQLGPLSVYQLISTRSVDRERQPELRVTLRCRDHGLQARVATELLTINVTDVNDNAPKFTNERYSFQTSEGNVGGHTIGILEVEDPDLGHNSEVKYVIDWPELQGVNPFVITSNGAIQASVPLDREMHPEGYRFTVIAKDTGFPSLTGTTQVEVALIDMNDCTPSFTQQVYHFTVREELTTNVTNEYAIGQVRATDCDIGTNAHVTYYLTPSDAPFQISPDGNLFATRSLDRETQSAFILSVTAVDSPQATERRLSSLAEIQLTVDDINDNSPVFLRPPFENGTNQVTLSVEERPGHLITWFEAADEDIGPNGNIRFYLLTKQMANMFELHAESGELLLRRELKSADLGIVDLVVLAKDHGIPTQTSSSNVKILIANVPPQTSTRLRDSNIFHGDTSSAVGATALSLRANKSLIIAIVIVTVFICTTLLVVIIIISRGGLQRLAGCGRAPMSHAQKFGPNQSLTPKAVVRSNGLSGDAGMEAYHPFSLHDESERNGYTETDQYLTNPYNMSGQLDFYATEAPLAPIQDNTTMSIPHVTTSTGQPTTHPGLYYTTSEHMNPIHPYGLDHHPRSLTSPFHTVNTYRGFCDQNMQYTDYRSPVPFTIAETRSPIGTLKRFQLTAGIEPSQQQLLPERLDMQQYTMQHTIDTTNSTRPTDWYYGQS